MDISVTAATDLGAGRPRNGCSIPAKCETLFSFPDPPCTYFAAISPFRNRLLFRATKIRLCKTLIRPVVKYGAETWKMTKKEEQALLIFERKIFRRI